MTQTTKPEAVRVVVEIDQNGLVDIASDYPVELVLLNHHVREDDVDIIRVRDIQVCYQTDRTHDETADVDYFNEVWEEIKRDIATKSSTLTTDQPS